MLGKLMQQQRLKLATAESCTGGMVAMLVTSIAGSSAWFDQGWVTYTNEAKQQQLGVPKGVFDEHGAVSEACVLAMAKGAIKQSQAHVSVAVSGIAGPAGGSEDKPVGMVWIAWGQKLGYAEAACYQFDGDRQAVREQATEAALDGIIKRLQGK